jgi:DNA helicase IV
VKNIRYYINLIEAEEQQSGWVLQHTKSISNAASKTTVQKIGGKIVQYASREAAQQRADTLNKNGNGKYSVAHINLTGPTIKR